MKIIDYSLIVFIIRRKPQHEKRFIKLYGDDPRFNLKQIPSMRTAECQCEYYHLGIIDYFQLFTMNKAMERVGKKMINADINLDTSSADPALYAQRFIDFFAELLDWNGKHD